MQAGRGVLRLHLSLRSSCWPSLLPLTGVRHVSRSAAFPYRLLSHLLFTYVADDESLTILTWSWHLFPGSPPLPQTHILCLAKSNGHPKSYSRPEYGRFHATKRTPVGVFSHKRVKNDYILRFERVHFSLKTHFSGTINFQMT